MAKSKRQMGYCRLTSVVRSQREIHQFQPNSLSESSKNKSLHGQPCTSTRLVALAGSVRSWEHMLFLSTMAVTNIYLKQEAADNFERSAYIPEHAFYEMADFIADQCGLQPSSTYNILDVGSGTGRTILNILSHFLTHGLSFKAQLFDVSEHMLSQFKNNLKRYETLQPYLRYSRQDANQGLPDSIFPDYYDLSFIVSVLQYLTDWQSFLSQVFRKLKMNGHLVQVELVGWYRLLDGSFDQLQDLDDLSIRFWQTYFVERQHYGQWNPSIKFSQMAPVMAYCQEHLNMLPVAEQCIIWESAVKWDDVLTWISAGPLSSLGSNILEDKSRLLLKDTMAQWLNQEQATLQTPFSVQWGFRIFIHRKETGHVKQPAKS